MKKVLLTAVAVFAFSFANAQEQEVSGFSQGSVFISGSVGFDSSTQGDAKSNDITFSPSFGYFVTENIALGARLDINSGSDDNGVAETKNSSFGANVFGRYYFTPASQFSVFGELAVGFGSGKFEPAVGPESKYNTFGVNAGVGVSYFLSSNFAIEAGWAGLGYNSEKADAPGAEAANTFGLNVDMSSLNLGLVYKF
ncbi:outer membrane beta-barrel protein [Flavobacterium ardleyense]|uniref:Outer membrane beta-barrel protein n=1 Tax=Flavobacterium ardleyense TaxID=2038737 RepID=A0ABW5ZB89_9FLAO